MNESSFAWAGAMAMVAVSVLLIAIAWPVVGEWEDDWKRYAHETRFGGVCTQEIPPPECADNPPVERWQLVPFVMTVGLAAGLLALCLPYGRAVRRRGVDGRFFRRARDFLKSQR